MKKLVFLLLVGNAITPAFASFHYVGRTLEPTAKVVTYPVRHPVKTTKGAAKGVAATVKAVF